jgi:hypothetical protein
MESTETKVFRKVIILLGITLLWLLPSAQWVQASDGDEAGLYHGGSSGYRNAADAAELIERGHASVTDSPQFRNGIRLTTWATEEETAFEPGLASAVYYFDVPSWTQYLKVTVRYGDVSRDDDIAGRLWIKTVDGDQGEVIESEEETLRYGDTFLLRSDRISEVIYVSSGRHVEGGMVEMHIVASGRDTLDVDSIQVEYLQEEPTRVTVVHHSYDDYWERWPLYWYGYHYFYWGECYWPRTSLIYVHWVWPHTYYWHTYRPWYRAHVVRYQHRHPYGYRRYVHAYRADPGHPHGRGSVLLRGSSKDGRIQMEKRREGLLPKYHASVPSVQETGRSARAKAQPVIPRDAVTKSRGKDGREPTTINKAGRPSQDRRPTRPARRESPKRMQSADVQRNSPSKPAVRESYQAAPRTREAQTQAVRQQNRTRNGWTRRIEGVHQGPRR